MCSLSSYDLCLMRSRASCATCSPAFYMLSCLTCLVPDARLCLKFLVSTSPCASRFVRTLALLRLAFSCAASASYCMCYHPSLASSVLSLTTSDAFHILQLSCLLVLVLLVVMLFEFFIAWSKVIMKSH